jgi:hypothetical protein
MESVLLISCHHRLNGCRYHSLWHFQQTLRLTCSEHGNRIEYAVQSLQVALDASLLSWTKPGALDDQFNHCHNLRQLRLEQITCQQTRFEFIGPKPEILRPGSNFV